MAYAILRFAKRKGGAAKAIAAHNERTKEAYASNPDIDKSRTVQNYHLIAPRWSYGQEIRHRISMAGCRVRKDSVKFVDTLVTVSPEFARVHEAEMPEYFNRAFGFLKERIGEENIISAVVHMDEKTPHLHLCFTPITKDGRLSAKEILGNRVQLSRWQDEFHAHMNKAFPVLQRGESSLVTKRKHIPTWLFKQSADLSKQQQAIEQVISQIGVLNAGKKRDELLQMVEPYFSQLEKHLGQMKKYQATIQYLTQENINLRSQIKEDNSSQKELELFMLKKENQQLRRFVDSIPPEVRKALREQQKAHRRAKGQER